MIVVIVGVYRNGTLFVRGTSGGFVKFLNANFFFFQTVEIRFAFLLLRFEKIKNNYYQHEIVNGAPLLES